MPADVEPDKVLPNTNGLDSLKAVGKGSTMARYVIYILRYNKGKINARSMSPSLYADAPAKFTWSPATDLEGCKTYIDALISGRRSVSDYYEKEGYVVDVEMPQNEEIKRVRVNISAFIDFILLKGYIDVPLWSRLAFVTSGKCDRAVPRDYIAALTPLLMATGNEGLLDADDWKDMNRKEMGIFGVDRVTLGHNYKEPAKEPAVDYAGVEQPVDDAEELREDQLHCKQYDKYYDLLTQLTRRGQRPSYVRRLGTYRGAWLWVGSSWSANGPWHVSERNTSMMLALKVPEP